MFASEICINPGLKSLGGCFKRDVRFQLTSTSNSTFKKVDYMFVKLVYDWCQYSFIVVNSIQVHLEKRSEALQSQIGDANKMNSYLKTEKETCLQEKDQLAKGKDELVSDVSKLMGERENTLQTLVSIHSNLFYP